MAEESAVKVCVRVRPLIKREETAGENAETVRLHWEADKQTIHQIDDGNLSKNFSFDRVFSAEETTLQLYQELAKPLVVSTVQGYNGTIFAYGQTSSGKTFTMMGSSLTPGVIPLAMEDVFQTIKNCPNKEFLLRVSYLEIYNETVTDLLCDSWKRKPLEIREGNNKNVYVADLTEELVTSPEQALSWIKKGEKNRHYGKTKMNQRSSRSHTIFRMILESRDRGDTASGENSDGAIIVSHLNLVDLAGAERASQTGAEGTRFKEGCNINRSLFTLGQVIKKLSDETQKGFTNYRDSKLTRILQNSLGGNAKTVIICTITPVTVEETLSTLQFASAAKNMKNDPHVTEVSDDGALLRRYRNEIVDLKRRLHEVSSVTQTTATEKETLSQILQEKDQLQREQQDRIRNLTKLLVTSSNFVSIKAMPKRRVTWGGKLQSPLQSPAFHNAGETDLSFAEPFMKKRKADMSVLTEQNEDVEELDFTLDVEMNQSSVRFSESEFLLPNQLESQLENETQQAMEKVETLERRVAELEKELQEKSNVSTDGQEQMKEGFEESVQLCEMLVHEKELLAAERDLLKQEFHVLTKKTDNLEKEKAALLQEMEKNKEMEDFISLEKEVKREHEKLLETEISSLKKASEASERKCQELEANLLALSEELKQKGELAEELQKSSDIDLVQQVKQLRRSLDDAVCLGRDAKKDWAHLRSENISLKERDVTLTAGYEKMEAEVKILCSQLEREKSCFKKMQTDLQRELQGAFEENTKLTALLDGKVPKSLIDSIELEKTVACLKKELEKSHEVERSLHVKIESLSALQDLPEKVESLMKQVCDLTEELCAVQTERESLLSAKASSEEEAQQLKENLQSSQEQLVKLLDDLKESEVREHNQTKKCVNITEQLETLRKDLECSLVANSQLFTTLEESGLKLKDSEDQETIENNLCRIQQVINVLNEKIADSESSRKHNDTQFLEHQEQLRLLNEELESMKAEREHLLSERTESSQNHAEELEKLLSTVTSLTEERDQLQEILQGVREEKNQLKRDLEENVEMRLNSEPHGEHQETDLCLQIHLESVKDLKEQLEAVKEERSQLKADLQDNVEMMIENQEELRQAQEKIRSLREKNQLLKTQNAEIETRLNNTNASENASSLTDLQERIRLMKEELESVRAERESLLSVNTDCPQTHTEQLEKLLSTVTLLTEERDQLQEILQGVREERNHLKGELDENEAMIIQVQAELKQQQHVQSEQQAERELQEATLQQQIQQLEEKLETMTEERCQMNSDLQKNVEMNAETQGLLFSLQEELQQQKYLYSDLESQSLEKESFLEQQVKKLSEQLESVQAESQHLLSATTTHHENPAEELENLRSTVTSLTEDKDQLQEILQGIREERNHFKRDLEEHMERIIQVQAELKQQQHVQSEQQAERELQEATLQQQIQQLEERLETMTEERCQMNSDLQKNVETTKQLSDELESVQAERDLLCSEKTNSAENHAEEFQKLLSTVTSLTEERDQLQVILERVREEGKRLKKDLEEYTEMVQHLENQLELVKDECSHLKSNLQENMDKVNNEEQPNSGTTSTEELRFKMEASTEQIQAFFVRFQLVINGASKPELGPLGDAAQMKEVMIFKLLDLLPKVSRNICSNVNKSTVQITKLAWDIKLHIKHCAKNYKTQFEALLKNDVALFEERRLQDLLLCRARAPSHSVKVAEKELLGVWDQRLLELLNKRGDYLQKMNSVLEKLEESLATQQTAVSDVLMARVVSNKELSALCMDQSIDFAAVERFLEQELAHCSAVAQATLLALQGLRDEHQGLLKELGTVRTQADSQLNEERSKTSTLLQMLEDTPVKNEAVFKDNLQTYNLQQLKGEIKEMHMRIEKLEKDKIKAADTVANHKQATQLLQTELQDARAQVIDMEGSIKILEEKLRNAEVLAKRRASPSALELEDLKAKVVKMELEMTALSSKHKEELLRLTSVLNHKEDSLRTLKETLRRSQQEGEQSYMEGEDLHARLISIGGRKVQSNIVIEKNKLAEEVKHLQKKISELESLVSTKQGEITKWKARALKLKRDAVDKPQSPCAPTKRCLPMSSEDFLGSPKKLLGSPKKLLGSPKKLLGSPKKLLGSPQMFLDSPQKFLDSPQKFLDSPKSKFFDVRPGSESMSINCPKQFFDNSTFETAQDADEKGDWCPLSPKQADVCRQQ
uniref:Centromere-associated protein E n=1 Tax=Esox lucius TaxID=8010 RepID=A0AAY5K0J5_ESOLU